MSSQSLRRILLLAWPLAAAAACGAAQALEWNLQPAASSMAAEIHDLPQIGHYPQTEAPADVLRAYAAFRLGVSGVAVADTRAD